MAEVERDLDLLFHYHHTGSLASGDKVTVSPATVNGNVPNDEVWEVLSYPVITFPDGIASGTVSGLLAYPVVDGRDQRDYLIFRGDPDLNWNPPSPFVDGPVQPLMARGVKAALDAMARPGTTSMLDVLKDAASLKVSSSLTMNFEAETAITDDFDVKLYGKKWKRDEFDRVIANRTIGGLLQIVRAGEGSSIQFQVPEQTITFNGWATMFGGTSQTSGLKVMPKANYAITTSATTKNAPLPLQYAGGAQANVGNAYQEMRFPYSIHQSGGDKILIVRGFGVRSRYAAATGAGTTMRYAWLNDQNNPIRQTIPQDMWLVTDQDNSRIYGYQAPVGPAGYYRSVPKFDYAIFNTVAVFEVEDDGTATVAAGDIAATLQALSIENYANMPGLTITRNGQPVSLGR